MRLKVRHLIALVVGSLAICLPSRTAQSEDAPRAGGDLFTSQVRPILAQHCFKCHGPDDQARKAGLRLDVREAAIKPAESGERAIVPGRTDESELVRRILSKDEAEMMPPPNVKNPLSEEKKKILVKWIAAGAEYKTHWSFVAPRMPALPQVKQADWPRNGIDHFILARLEAAGLKPSPEADRYALMRRLSFDLIGLPPTPEEADAFVNDNSPNAYEKLVDRLLASPHYGERWARRWLDLARYADTNGYEKDRARSIWPYRDWVINALNADMRFDRFTIDQIAGDMLPGATTQQRIATGFHRNTMLNEEGGIDPLEFRFHAMTDRVATTGTVWLGLTLGCVQCHTHKYDPVSHREYYGLMAFLDNADEPEMEIPNEQVAKQRQEIERKISGMISELPNKFPPEEKSGDGDTRSEELRRKEHLDKKFRAWVEAEAAKSVRWAALKPIEATSNLPLLSIQDDSTVIASGDQTKSDTYDLTFRTDLKRIRAIRLEALPDEQFPRRGPGRVYYEGPAGDFTLCEFTVAAGDKPAKIAKASHSFANGKFTAEAAIDGHPQTGWSIDGGQGRAHSAVFQLAEPLADAGEFKIRMLFERHYSAGLGKFRLSVTTDERAAVARDFSAEAEAALLVPAENRTPEQNAALLRQFTLVAPELAKEREAADQLRKTMPAPATTLVMLERPDRNPRLTHRRHRGEFLQPKEEVRPGVPGFLSQIPSGQPLNRLTFARWLVSPENPLTARVTMNRQWAAIFSRGLVRTTEDFGIQGEPPSHPELLDWLALEFIRQGWSLKKMHRLIVTSATYRQSSQVTAPLLEKDPENRLLGRGLRFRLEAEMIRDGALRAAGLLSAKIGGPSVFPPQPAGVTTEGTYGQLQWKVSTGEDRYRRALYTFSKRTAPFAMLTTFDGPSGEFCLARREVSNTPLQALTLLNDPVFMEAAQALAARATAREGGAGEKAAFVFRHCLTRPPTAAEQETLVKFQATQKERFEKKELDPAAFAGEGQGDVIERAAWTAVIRALMNLDETVTKN